MLKNKDERIRLRNRKVELQILKERLTEETTKLEGEIEDYVKRNDELEKDNEKQKEAISAFLQRIEINTLLKDVDVDDLRLLAQNNTMVSCVIANSASPLSNTGEPVDPWADHKVGKLGEGRHVRNLISFFLTIYATDHCIFASIKDS